MIFDNDCNINMDMVIMQWRIDSVSVIGCGDDWPLKHLRGRLPCYARRMWLPTLLNEVAAACSVNEEVAAHFVLNGEMACQFIE